MKWRDKVLAGGGICLAVFAIWSAVRQYRIESATYELCEQICENKVQQEVLSPDRQQKVIVFTHDCGAAGYPHTIVALLRKSDSIPKHQPIEERFAAASWEGHDKVNLRWRDQRTLLVEEFGGGEDESSAPFHERLKVETNGRTKILKVSPMNADEMSQ